VLAVGAALALAGGLSVALAGKSPDVSPQGWEISKDHPEDVFTFARLRYSSGGGGRRGRRGWGWGGGGGWDTDYPDSDQNFSYRLQQVTSLEVTPRHVVVDITDPKLLDYPWSYMIEPGRLLFSEEEVTALRTYLLAGGFLMVDDFWGDEEWANFEVQIRRVFPDREIKDLTLDHPIFHGVFELKEWPQVPSIHAWMGSGQTYEFRPNGSGETPHFRAIFDDKGRIMVMICHNTDLGDGWEREGEDPGFFKTFAEPKAYPMGINILFYAMTH
jgi:hypothetical protein